MTKARPSPKSISALFVNTVKGQPHRPALITAEKAWTYDQLGRLVRAGRDLLEKHVTGQNRRVMIAGNNHPAYIVGYFAAQWLGIPTVEVGPLENIDRLVEIVGNTETGFVLTDVPGFEDALKGRVTAVSFDNFLDACKRKAAKCGQAPDAAPRPKDPAAEASIIYTSGTTGTPKGVILTHRNFLFVVDAVVQYLNLAPEDRYALILPLSHTYGKTVLLTSVTAGAAVVLLNNFSRPQEFAKSLSELKCTALSAVPYHAHVLLKWCNLAQLPLDHLRALTFSANKLPATTIDRLNEALPRADIFSMYGLTETTTRSCFVPPHLLPVKKESCGRPLPGVELRIVDETGARLPAASIGEVLIRGPNVMAGYFGDDALTAETFRDGWLKTGDLGLVDEDGFLFLKGRKKEIIKCAGERISPMEIEEVLLEHPGVAECAVLGSPDPVAGEIVHAFVVGQDGFADESELKVYCARRLSHHKLPRRYTFVSSLPRTGSGKVKKYLLEQGEFDG